MNTSRHIRAALAAALLVFAHPGGLLATTIQPTAQASIEVAHAAVWGRFVDTNGLVIDYLAPIAGMPTAADATNGFPNALAWHIPTENGAFYTGIYLPAQCERARRTGNPADRDQARMLANGLLKAASCSSVTGFIARGVAPDGTTHYPIGSDDQTHPWFYGLHAYWASGIPSNTERNTIAAKVAAVATALDSQPSPHAWDIPCDGVLTGQYRGWLKSEGGFRASTRYLFILQAVYEMTGDTNWLAKYTTALTEPVGTTTSNPRGWTRVQFCAAGEGQDIADNGWNGSSGQYWSYIYVGAAGSLRYLAATETNPVVKAQFQAGLTNTLNYLLSNNSQTFNKANGWNDTTINGHVFGQSDWRSVYAPTFDTFTQSYGPQRTVGDAVSLGGAQNSVPQADGTVWTNSSFPWMNGVVQTVGTGTRMTDESTYLQYPLAASSIAALCGIGDTTNNRSKVDAVIKKYSYTSSTLSYTPAYSNTCCSSIFFAETAYYAMPALVINVPSNIVTNATSSSGAVVTYSVTAADTSGGGTVTVTNTPASGSTFPVGTTMVNCAATSTSGSTWSSSFTVMVQAQTGNTYAGSTYYVAANGNDGNAGTDINQPWLTLGKAAGTVAAGDTVYVRGGTYTNSVCFFTGGTPDRRISILAYSNEIPIIDGTTMGGPLGLGQRSPYSPLVTISGTASYLTLAGFAVINGAFGIEVDGTNDVVQNTIVSNMWNNGIFIRGSGSMAQSNTIAYCCLNNSPSYRQSGTVWASGLSAARGSADGIARQVVLRGNTVHDIYGEALSTYEADGTLIESNVVYNGWATDIYISDSRNVLCRGNLAYATTNFTARFATPTLLELADEKVSVPRSCNNLVVNNLFWGGLIHAFDWTGVNGSGLVGDLIANNTFVNAELLTGSAAAYGVNNYAAVVQNNIFYRNDGGTIGSVPATAGLTFSHNLWYPSRPVNTSGTGDLISDPKLALAGPTGAGQLSPAYFTLATNSPAHGNGAAIYGITDSCWVTNQVAAPDIGASVSGEPCLYTANATIYPLLLLTNPTNGILVALGGGNHVAGETVAISALGIVPGSPYLSDTDQVFVSWTVNSGSPAIANTASTITALTMPAGAVSVTACFSSAPNGAPACATVIGLANPTNAGSVAGGGSFPVGSTHGITATASNGWAFVHWSDSVTNNPRWVVVPSNGATCVADFSSLTIPILATVAIPTSQFGFSVSGALNQTVVVEASTNLIAPVWIPLQTNTLGVTPFIFRDSDSSHLPTRFYRLRNQ